MTSLLTEIYGRNELIWGKDGQQELFKKHVAVIGIGGVGSYLAEALARSGIGTITLVDFDVVSESNINRQLHALIPDIGKFKVNLMKQRINLINPHIQVNEINEFCSESLIKKIINKNVDFVADAIDTLKSKIELIEICKEKGIPVITCLGAGNRLKPEELYITDISEINTKKCPFAKNVIYQLKKRGLAKDLPAVASLEKPFKTEKNFSVLKVRHGDKTSEIKKFSPGSSPFVPPVAGYLMAGFIVRNLIQKFLH